MLAEIERFLADHAVARPEPERMLATIVCAITALVGEAYLSAAPAEVTALRGRVIKCAPDVTLATFDSPARAIRCAVALRAAAGESSFRAGVHTGEVEISADGIAGATGDLAARVAAKAKPGEILATQIVKDLVLGSGIAFAERGRIDDHRAVAVADAGAGG
jgi:class 3 adenylate cyclase